MTGQLVAPKASDFILDYLAGRMSKEDFASNILDGWVSFGPEEEGWEREYMLLEDGGILTSWDMYDSSEMRADLRRFAERLRERGY
jgi:hypothetical protein